MIFLRIAFYPILGLPLIAWDGFLTLICLLITAYLGYTIYKGKNTLPLKWHWRFAILTLAMALIHGTLGLLAFLRI